MKKIIPALAAISLALSGCAQGFDQYGNPIGGGSMVAPAAGALGGGAMAGLACSPLGSGNGTTAIVGACTLLGGIAGLLMGQQYSQQRQVAQAYQAPRVPMMAPHVSTMHRQAPYEDEGVLRMGPQYSNRSTGEQCREFQHTARVGGKAQQVYGTACQQRDGTWKVIS